MKNDLPADAIGRLMDPRVVALRSDWKVRKAIDLLHGAPAEALYYLYVTDADNRLVGVVSMRQLLLAAPQDAILSLMSREVVSVRREMDLRDVLALAEMKNFVAFPVVDAEGRLVGAIRPTDLVSIAQSEAGSYVQRLFGAGGDERALEPASLAVRKRLPWLMVNLATAFVAAAVVGLFESVIARVSALAVLLPIVAGQGGNTGAQALAVVIRGLAVREFGSGMAWRIMLKELGAGLVNGLAVAAVTAGGVYAWYRRPGLALVIGLAMVVNMAVAGLTGAAVPLALHALGRDPAQSSSIFMTTVTDVVGFGAFLGFALLFMPLLT